MDSNIGFFTGYCGRMSMFERRRHSKPCETSSKNFFPPALRSHAPNWFICRSYTGGHRGIKATHQHSLGIHSSLVHIRHTPAPRSWESKYTDHLDCTHCRPHRPRHRHTLEEEKEARELLLLQICTLRPSLGTDQTECVLATWGVFNDSEAFCVLLLGC